jgi:hypothetical protein
MFLQKYRLGKDWGPRKLLEALLLNALILRVFVSENEEASLQTHMTANRQLLVLLVLQVAL